MSSYDVRITKKWSQDGNSVWTAWMDGRLVGKASADPRDFRGAAAASEAACAALLDGLRDELQIVPLVPAVVYRRVCFSMGDSEVITFRTEK